MWITLLKSKLHLARVTDSNVEYEGSCAIDAELLRVAGIYPHEQLHIYNLDNAERFVTYAIEAAPGSGIISANGAAAHLASVGHRLIICSYRQMEESSAANYKPCLVYLDKDNRIQRIHQDTPVQAA